MGTLRYAYIGILFWSRMLLVSLQIIHTYCALNSITEWSWILESSKLDFFCETKREHIQEYNLQISSATACIIHKTRLLVVQRIPPFPMSAYNINADFLEQTVLCRIVLILPYYSVAYTYPYLPGFFSNEFYQFHDWKQNRFFMLLRNANGMGWADMLDQQRFLWS